ncbi:hypothetical protein [Reyranella sp.]|jgi:hypothetical protein|uniref:hypothetical protein n=1 Tax=Reyranella sp. TaxID=1929291 RepID=UPI000BD8311B|nr:hypothetical protein [Reyranella sp.]OYY37261.1 MAG: hypothetical protein B7Y57_23710 [Rhodospirillales bacterium 35-66-84]OYZ94233.1 MAG: hypothetical protein B7Y08_13945 [Rhodospirillales bacterium 24-66-33]OZB23072.1 MAG: hypothetical protein B7X63_21090 [Rhodospirillales bacterium 39-66-50]HQS17252.1 hypothetical protein [Reyranella sp.]HQT13677.1 hypothetical protein [Reyranella sp.]
MHDPNDARQVRQAEQLERIAQDRVADDLCAVMGSEQGRRFVHGLLGLCDLRSDGYVPGGPEAQRHQDYMAGRRSIGIELLSELERHAPDLTEQMSSEARLNVIETGFAAMAAEEQNDG